MKERFLFFFLRGWLWLRRTAQPNEVQWNLGFAALVGVVGALLGLLFRQATNATQALMTGLTVTGEAAFTAMPWWQCLAVPTLGGVLAGLVLTLGQKYIRQKPTDYMEAITLGDGRVPARSSLYRSLASLLSIASGTAIGREGPLVQLSAMSASVLGGLRKLPPARRRLLVACGAAAGIAAAYNAPIAAALFVSEITVGSLAMESLGPLIFASVASIVTIHIFSDASPLYRLDHFALPRWDELIFFGAVGIVCGLMAGLFLALLNQFKKWFHRVPGPLALKMGLGGVVVGGIALLHPEVTGNGYDTLKSLLTGHLDPGLGQFLWEAVLIVLLARMVATASAFGSGAVGGVFTPTLVVGACTGSLCWHALYRFFPDMQFDQAGFATIGMGAVLAAATQAPFMAILMIFEMTLSYEDHDPADVIECHRLLHVPRPAPPLPLPPRPRRRRRRLSPSPRNPHRGRHHADRAAHHRPGGPLRRSRPPLPGRRPRPPICGRPRPQTPRRRSPRRPRRTPPQPRPGGHVHRRRRGP